MSSSSQPVPRDPLSPAEATWDGRTGDDGPAHGQERKLHRHLGYWRLAGIGLGDIIGSGWLFAAMYAARIAGPLSLLCWLAGGALAALVALVMVDLGSSRPEAGGTVRWPLYANGPLVASMLGWAVLLAVGANAAEVAAIVQYLAHWRPQLYNGSRLTWSGVGLALVITVLLGVLNALGVRLFARLNLLITVVKLVVPVLTVVLLLLAARFEPRRLTEHGGFAPYGWSAGLTALSVGGIVYAFNGFQSPVEFSGEVRDPRRDVPRSVLTGLALAVLLYLGLQLTFLAAVPERALTHGWRGVDFDSPFAELALLLNLHWLSMVMYADAVLSPGGSALVGLAATARRTYALAKNGTLPRWFMRVDAGSGIPRRALLLNLAITAMFLAPLGGWQDIVSTLGDLLLMVYATSAVAARTLRPADPATGAGRVPAMRWVAPLAFVVATLFVYWSAWHRLRVTVPLTLLGLPLFWVTRRGEPAARLLRELRKGAWLIVWLLALLTFSAVGGFGGGNLVPKPYDSLAVGGCGLAVFFWGVRSGRRHLAETAG
ncbi:APC family permease [Kitasatospora kifunensis]|uniref:Amino acid transporter n=1 Tax=Kitasatospora kifunensis TaxID=58351 RepID=A0A7W7VXG0_KITKI|nr:APC family permease [Kitasatospora kifunensis]MBB4925918.1 amino acid transporter [Kitasatospora kifunensis]